MILWLSITFIAGFFVYFLLTRKKEKVSQLQKPDFEKEKVYLVQFPGKYPSYYIHRLRVIKCANRFCEFCWGENKS